MKTCDLAHTRLICIDLRNFQIIPPSIFAHSTELKVRWWNRNAWIFHTLRTAPSRNHYANCKDQLWNYNIFAQIKLPLHIIASRFKWLKRVCNSGKCHLTLMWFSPQPSAQNIRTQSWWEKLWKMWLTLAASERSQLIISKWTSSVHKFELVRAEKLRKEKTLPFVINHTRVCDAAAVLPLHSLFSLTMVTILTRSHSIKELENWNKRAHTSVAW